MFIEWFCGDMIGIKDAKKKAQFLICGPKCPDYYRFAFSKGSCRCSKSG